MQYKDGFENRMLEKIKSKVGKKVLVALELLVCYFQRVAATR
jgi:hypothetical protein